MKQVDFNNPDLHSAILDYYYLSNRQYPNKFALKAVGDHYRLTGTERTLLFRGVFSEKDNNLRKQKLISNINSEILYIDAYNVLFTFLNYKLGKIVFIGTDNFCRDTGSLFGKIKKREYFTDIISNLINFLQTFNFEYVVFFLDSPVSFSREHKIYLEKQIEENHLMAEVSLVKSADAELKKNVDGILCTSDSAIIDFTQQPVADLARLMLSHFYKPDLLNLQVILNSLL